MPDPDFTGYTKEQIHDATYDNFGKGDWNRQRDMDKYAENKEKIDWDKPYESDVVKSTKELKPGVTRITYG